jgi:hypothetical protein
MQHHNSVALVPVLTAMCRYGEPYHGLALFKHHHPLTWEEHQLR